MLSEHLLGIVVKSKLECLFGYHTFDDKWEVKNSALDVRICSCCRHMLSVDGSPVPIVRNTDFEVVIKISDREFHYRKDEKRHRLKYMSFMEKLRDKL